MKENLFKYYFSFCGIVFIILYADYYISFLPTNWKEYFLNIELLTFIWIIVFLISRKREYNIDNNKSNE